MTGGRVRGGVLITRFEYIQDKHGSSALKVLKEDMRERGYLGYKNHYDFRMTDFYPVDHLLVLLDSYMELHGEEAFDTMSRDMAMRKGVVGWFVSWAGSPGIVLKKAGRYWPEFYDFGELEGKIINENEGVLIGKKVSPKPIFCRVLTHYYRGVLEYLRTKDFQLEHTLCQHQGDPHCEWHVTWDDR
ncbi:MAG: hypothetical protein QCI38_03765 [Candidatus Thermoplasmatota archaeon]|nr:hypothetical protein [Candidatus Thermoplasmatota archaeon]